MDNEPTKPVSKVVYVVLGVLAVAIIAGLAVYAFLGKNKSSTNGPAQQAADNQPKDNHATIVKKDVDTTKLPDRFPSDIPLEAGAKIDANYNQTTKDGQFQATRNFQTAKTLDENFKIYSDYIKTAGWTLAASVNQDKLKVLSAKRNNATLLINMNENSETKVKTVSISYSEFASTTK